MKYIIIFNGLEWTIPLHQFHFGWRAIHPLILGWLTTNNNFILGGLKKMSPFLLPLFFNLVLQTYQPHYKACNPSSSSPYCIFGVPNILVSSVFRNNMHSSISSAIAHSSVSSIVPSPLLILTWAPSRHCHSLCL